MLTLEEKNSNIQKCFLDGQFSVQIHHISGAAKGVNIVDEMNRKSKNEKFKVVEKVDRRWLTGEQYKHFFSDIACDFWSCLSAGICYGKSLICKRKKPQSTMHRGGCRGLPLLPMQHPEMADINSQS